MSHTSYPFNSSQIWNIQTWQNCVAFNQGNLFWCYQTFSH